MRDNKECCPYCNADLQGKPIPKESQKVYGLPISTKNWYKQYRS